jgi:hypothetical protein
MYNTIYDEAAPLNQGHFVGDGFLIVCGAFFVLGVVFLLWCYGTRLPFSFRAPGNVWIVAVGVMGMSAAIAVSFLLSRLSLSYIPASDERVVSGVVREYIPWQQHVHAAELVVGDARFEFWGNINESWWDASAPLDIHEGDSLRLTLIRGSIVKVEKVK